MPSTILAAKTVTESQITIEKYKPEYHDIWNDFVSKAKNGVFLFDRNYMEYHALRFIDHSLLFYHNKKLVAVMPANIENGVLHSHGGLSFGGVISVYNMKTHIMLGVFRALINHCKEQGITEVVYKPVPYIYHVIPSDEDLYALFANNAKLMARSVSSCIYLPKTRKFDNNRQDNIRKAKNNNLTVKESLDYDTFMTIEREALDERHGVKPVHTVEEIKTLANKFPNNIRLFASYKDETMLAGIIIYESKNVAHMQYASNSKEGWAIGAQDIIEDYLISTHYKDKRFFDFGISTEKMGQVLNVGLIKRKENFGASAVMYDLYHLTL
jgi:hypothetical protein